MFINQFYMCIVMLSLLKYNNPFGHSGRAVNFKLNKSESFKQHRKYIC